MLQGASLYLIPLYTSVVIDLSFLNMLKCSFWEPFNISKRWKLWEHPLKISEDTGMCWRSCQQIFSEGLITRCVASNFAPLLLTEHIKQNKNVKLHLELQLEILNWKWSKLFDQSHYRWWTPCQSYKRENELSWLPDLPDRTQRDKVTVFSGVHRNVLQEFVLPGLDTSLNHHFYLRGLRNLVEDVWRKCPICGQLFGLSGGFLTFPTVRTL